MRKALYVLLIICVVFCIVTPAFADLYSYVHAADPSYSWKFKTVTTDSKGSRIYELELHSQVWEGIPWTHRVLLFMPAHLRYRGDCTLYITGGSGGMEEMMIGKAISNATDTPLAILFNIPNEPLFGGKSEDALIAYTFNKYLDGGNSNWLLLFPMVKSAVKCMDALQAFTRQRHMDPLKHFIVAGASKRGWTSWLAGCIGDPRVSAIIPMSYDNLNLQAQMPHQLKVWGHYSAMIDDYTKLGIQKRMTTPRGVKLTRLVDPWTYRSKMTMPKFMIRGSNDPYWTTDAMNLYWNGLPSPKWMLILPNSGHELNDHTLLVRGLISYIRAIFSKTLPEQPTWRFVSNKPGEKLFINAPAAKDAMLWVTTSHTKDFRKRQWKAILLKKRGAEFVTEIKKPASGYKAVYAQIDLRSKGGLLPVTTSISILGAD